MWLLGLLVVFIIIVGIGLIIKPVWFLELKDIFRVNSDVEYSDFAIMMTRISGICSILLAVYLIFKFFFL